MRLLPKSAKFRAPLVCGLALAVFLFTLVSPATVRAVDEYECGTYGGAAYGSCDSSASGGGGSSSSGGSSDQSSRGIILLNDYNEYLNSAGDGKTLDLQQGQVVEFILDDVTHTATVKLIGPDYVVITIASEPFDVTIKMKETVLVDVNKDGHDDISIRLNGINNGLASLTFKQLAQATGKAPATPNIPAATTAKKVNWLFWVSLSLVVLAIGIVIWLILRRRKRRDDINGSPPPTVIGPQ